VQGRVLNPPTKLSDKHQQIVAECNSENHYITNPHKNLFKETLTAKIGTAVFSLISVFEVHVNPAGGFLATLLTSASSRTWSSVFGGNDLDADADGII